jgi:predicted nucleotidyltransferase
MSQALPDVLQSHRAATVAAAARYGVTKIRLVSDIVREVERGEPEIDLLVRPGRNRGPTSLVRLAERLNELLGAPVNLISEDALGSAERARLMVEAVPL